MRLDEKRALSHPRMADLDYGDHYRIPSDSFMSFVVAPPLRTQFAPVCIMSARDVIKFLLICDRSKFRMLNSAAWLQKS